MTQLTGEKFLVQSSKAVYNKINLDDDYFWTLMTGIIIFVSSILSVIILKFIDLKNILVLGTII